MQCTTLLSWSFAFSCVLAVDLVAVCLLYVLRIVTVKCAEAVLIAETHGPRSVHSPATFAPLGITEHLEKGDLVGIDAEFVTVNQVCW